MKKNSKKGFTLMEMLIVVTIIAILAAIILPRFITSSGAAKRSVHEAQRQTINSQIELYYFNFDRYPTDMSNDGWGSGDSDGNSRTDWQEYWPDGVPTTCNINIAWELDDVTGRVKNSGHDH